MSREQQVTGLVLKKQPLGEADELVTIFFAELGKMRVVAKAAKLPKSRLQFALQPLSVAQVVLVGRGSLPQVIRAMPVTQFTVCMNDLERLQLWYQVAELVLRFLPDHQPNDELYAAVLEFLAWLNNTDTVAALFPVGLIKCELAILAAVGHQFVLPREVTQDLGAGYVFDVAAGGIVSAQQGVGTVVPVAVVQALHAVLVTPYANLLMTPDYVAAQQLVHACLVYNLERETRADRVRL
jgi:DNA repair protein RecO (recombination protein O)